MTQFYMHQGSRPRATSYILGLQLLHFWCMCIC